MAVTFDDQTKGKPASYMRITEVTWTSDGSGDASGTSTEEFYGLLYGIETVPDSGGTAPSDNYDVTVTNERGLELLGGTTGATSTDGNGANRDVANTEFAAADPYPIPVQGPLTITIDNAGASKGGTIYIHHEPR